jgi:translation initiation factor IF-3
MGPFIGDHDFDVRINRALGFLKQGHKVKVIVKFTGRELGKKEFGFNLLNKFTETLKDLSKVERPVHFEGKTLVIVLSPLKVGEKNKNE